MLSRNIEAEHDRHIKKLRTLIFNGFVAWTDAEIARRSTTGVLPLAMENPINRADVFFGLIEDNYNAKFRQAIDSIKDLFGRHNLSFRLIDIDECMHGYHRMTMMWEANNYEYIFDFLFDSSQDNAFESFYRLGHLNGCGTPINGDILDANSARLFDDNSDLPDWFVKGLQAQS